MLLCNFCKYDNYEMNFYVFLCCKILVHDNSNHTKIVNLYFVNYIDE